MAHALADDEKKEEKKFEKKKSADHGEIQEALPTPPDGGWGWLVVFASFMIHVVTDGITYSFEPIYSQLTNEFGKSKAATAWVNSILIGTILCSGPLCSMAVNKWGCLRVTIAGAIVGSLSLLLSSFVPGGAFGSGGLYMLYGSVGIGTGFGFGLIYLPAIVCVSCYFEKRRSLATGIAVCGSGLGTYAFAALFERIMPIYEWRGTLQIVAVLVAMCVIFGFFFRELETTEKPTEISMVELGTKDENHLTVPLTNGEAKNGIDRHQSLSNVNHTKYYFPDSKNDSMKIAMSHPALAKGTTHHPEHGHLFGSGVMNRDDIFLQASVENIRARSASLGFKDKKETARQSLRSLPSGKGSQDFEKTECIPIPSESISIIQRMLDISLMKDPIFILFVVSNFCTSIGFNAPYLFMSGLAQRNYTHITYNYMTNSTSDNNLFNMTNLSEHIGTNYTSGNVTEVVGWKIYSGGISKEDADSLLKFIGIGNTVGRIVLGYIADQPWVNRLLVYNICLTVCGVSTILAVFSTTMLLYATCAFVFGFTAGAYVGLTSVVLVDLMGLDRLTNAFGLLLFFQGIASFLGLPLAGWFRDVTGTYDMSFYVAGGMLAASGSMLYIMPYLQRREKKKKTANIVVSCAS